jgi:hypothetical protein
MKRKRVKSLLFSMLVSLACFAQTGGYRFRADIDPVKETGFYNIILTPQLHAHLKTDYSDLRIVNASGNWVPHLLRNPGDEQTKHETVYALPIIKNEGNSSSSEITISTPHLKISNLIFTLRNTLVERFGNLTGSEDSINWFIVNDSVQLSPVASDLTGESELIINFPQNNYRFYKLSIANKGKAPYAITTVTSRNAVNNAGADQSLSQPLLNPIPSVTQKDSGKISYIRVVQKAAFHTDAIQLIFSGSTFFNRLAGLYVPVSGMSSNNAPGRFVTSFNISNNSPSRFAVPLFNDSVFYILIHNEDNPPLSVEEVKTWSAFRIATVYLEKRRTYGIIMGNQSAISPSYDLNIDEPGIATILPVAPTGKVKEIQPGDVKSSSYWYKNKWMLWLVIAAAASVLLFFTIRLIKDMGETKDGIS